MRRISTLLIVTFNVCLALSLGAQTQDLKRIPLDDASLLGLKLETDTSIKVEGKASVRITTAGPATVCLERIEGLNVEDAALIFKSKVKADLQGEAFLEMWVQVAGKPYFSRGLDNTLQGKSEWKELHTAFFARKGQKIEKVWLDIVITGQGTVWVDDAKLSQGPLAGTSTAPLGGTRHDS
jgi:hypothetical protein